MEEGVEHLLASLERHETGSGQHPCQLALEVQEVLSPEVINDESRAAMRNALKRIQSGEYAKMFIAEGAHNYPSMTAARRNNAAHPIEQVGEKLRAMMPWIASNKIVDKSKN